MADDFVQQIARLLGQSPEDTERTLHALADSIRDEVETSGEATIEGLGVFRREGDALAFEPAPSLARAVNHRYAGLPAIESGPRPSEPEAADAPAPEGSDDGDEMPEEAQHDAVADPFAEPPEPTLGLPPEPEPEPVRDLVSDPEPLDEPAPAEDALDAALAGAFVSDSDEPDAFDPDAFLDEPPVSDEPPSSTFDTAEPDDEPFSEPTETEWDMAAAFQAEDEPEAEDGSEAEDEPEAEDEVLADAELADEPADAEEDAAIDALLDGVWTPATGATDTPHPLGPMPPELMEDADYSLVDDAATDEPEDGEPAAPEPVEPDLHAAPPLAPDAPAPEPPTPAPAFAATAASAATPSPDRRARPPRERSGGGRLPLYLGVVAAVVVGTLAVLWFMNREPVVDPVAERSAPTVADTAAASPSVPSPAAEALSDTAAAAAEAVPEEPEPAPSADPLRSTAGIDVGEGGFTWVVASEFDRASAEAAVADFRAQGFRAGVVAEEAGGRTRYRVALGQFASLDEANQHRPNLPAGVPADTWLLRL